jgi:serine/threonine protein kinase
VIRRALLALLLLLALGAPAEAQKKVVHKGKTYVTGRYLGGGRWAQVYEAAVPGGKGKVAIKIPTAHDPSFKEGNTFRRELSVMRKVKGKHRTLPKRVIGIGKVEGTDQDALIVDLINGGQLPARMAASDAVHVTLELLDGVEQLHRVGLWHADITPGNVLQGDDGAVYLLDFGRTRKIEEPREGSGYPGYSAPEATDPSQKRGDLQDIHAIGAILRSRLATIPPPLAPIIDKATNRDPKQRFQNVAEFRAALIKARRGLGDKSGGQR